MKTRVLQYGLAVLAVLFLGACASTGTNNLAIGSKEPGVVPPAPVAKAADVPAGQYSHDYWVLVYPGLRKFDPNPRLTLEEYNQLVQLDWYCTKKVKEEFQGKAEEMVRQGLNYGALQGLFGGIAARLAFGPVIDAGQYLAYIGGAGFGGGLASGKVTYEMALSVAHGYCMTLMTYKADQLEGALSRIGVSPVYTGKAKIPVVSDEKAPTFSGGRGDRGMPPPLR